MVQKVDQNLQPLVTGELLVKLAVTFFCFEQTVEFAYGLLHNQS